MMTKPKALAAIDWLNRQPMAQDLAVQVRRLADLQRAVDECAPVKGLQVASLEQDVLVLTTANASMAAKFRQFERSLILGMIQRGWRIERVRVKPLPSSQRYSEPPVPPQAKPPVPQDALRALDQLRDQSEEGALRNALTRLLRNQKQRHDLE